MITVAMYNSVIISLFLTLLPSKFQTISASSSQDFTFAQPQSFLRIEPFWPLPAIREVTFHFKTVEPHGLLLYHGLTNPPVGNYPHYEMYLMLENARLKVIHVFDHEGLSDSYFVGKGLNRDKWHKVRLKINPGTGELTVSVDDISINVIVPTLVKHPNYDIKGFNSTSFLYFGGTDTYNPILNRQYNYERFVGCLGKIMFGHSDSPLESVQIQSFSQTDEGCIDRCEDEDHCLHGGRCINYYKFTACDCFGTTHEGDICQNDAVTTVTLRGYSYFTYRVYYWRNRVQSEANMLSLCFRTFFANSVLLYGAGEHPEYNYIAISISEGVLHFEIDFGDGPLNTTLGYHLHEAWHNVTMIHHGSMVKVILDNRHISVLETTGKHHHLHLDPEVYIGAAPPNAKGLKSHRKFVGCLRELYFNRKNILLSVNENDSALRHYGIFPIEYGCSVVDVIPITFRLPESRLLLTGHENQEFHVAFEFKTSQKECVLASGHTHTEDGSGSWEIYLLKGTIYFIVVSKKNGVSNKWTISEGNHLSNDDWHHIDVHFNNRTNDIKMKIDFSVENSKLYSDPVEFTTNYIIGSSSRNLTKGFVGCIRDIYINGRWIDPRSVIGTDLAQGKISFDNCQLVNPCNNPQACEHGGKCFVENGDTYCDCDGTGYTGKTCHFSIYKRTCEELYLIGHKTSGDYITDIDRNGPFPPASVRCIMNEKNNGIITTIVKTNMPHEMIIRKENMEGFYFDITYEGFTAPMLQSLIKHSKQCTQYIKYECFKMPLGLRTYTWMKSSATDHYVTTIGSNLHSGRCPCSASRSCANESLMCNCDISDARWRVDESTFTDPKDLGITRVYVLQPPKTPSDAEARLTIGSLECVQTDTQQYVITFKTPLSFVEVPGWYRGDMAFSFRTSNSKAVLVYQAAVHSEHGYFRVLLINDFELSFEFTVNGKPESVIVTSERKLNTGEWQQVWVDHDTHHMRFTVNSYSSMKDLGDEEEAGPFEGPLYVGGVPRHHAGDSTIKEGFIGCFRGLVISDEVVNLHQHLIKSSPDIVVNCQPSCSPNPCKYGAKCLEYWGSYECECANPIAHSGKNCEENINVNSVTFLTANSFYYSKTDQHKPYTMHPIFKEDILLNFRTYVEKALLLYANDHLNNFVQLHFAKGSEVHFTFNSDQSIVKGIVEVPGISRGLPVQIKLSRQPDKTVLIVNDRQTVINEPMKFIEEYSQEPWLEGQDLEVVKPARGTFGTVPHADMFIGSTGKGTVSYLPGFVGCMQGLKIGNSVFDLDKTPLDTLASKGQLRSGCKMLCDEIPCQNGGICIEDWKNNYTKCDCSLTSYTGDTCQKDIGGIFDGKSTVTCSFNLSPPDPHTVIIRLSFSTDTTNIAKVVLLFLQLTQSTYILVSLTLEGALLLEEGRGNNEVIKTVIWKNGTLADDHRHWLYYKQSENQTTIIVDGEQHTSNLQHIDIAEKFEDVSSRAIIGGIQNSNRRYAEYANFHGCISNVIIKLDGMDIKPLETAFGYQKGATEKVKTDGPLTEGKCAGFRGSVPPTIVPGNSPNTNEPKNSIPPIHIPYKTPFIETEAHRLQKIMEASSMIAAVMAVFFFIVLLGLSIYIWKLQKRHKRRQLREEMLFFQGRRSISKGNKPVVNFVGYSSETQPLTASSEPSEEKKNNIGNAKPILQPRRKSSTNYDQIPEEDEEEESSSPDTKKFEIEPDSPNLPIKSSSSQELEWDPAADNADLITTAMDEIDPDEMDEDGLPEEIENPGPLRSQILKNAPLASASEVTINRLSQTFT